MCLWVSVCECGHAMIPVWRQDSLWDSVVSFLHVGHQAYPSHRPAVISLVPPVLGKLPFWAAMIMQVTASFPSLVSISWYWSRIPAAVLFPQPGGPVSLCSSLCRSCTLSSMLFSLISWLLPFRIENRCSYAAFRYSRQKSRSLSLVALGDALWSFLG